METTEIDTAPIVKVGSRINVISEALEGDEEETGCRVLFVRSRRCVIVELSSDTSIQCKVEWNGRWEIVENLPELQPITLRLINRILKDTLAWKEGRRKFFGYELDMMQLVWGRNMMDGWKIDIYDCRARYNAHICEVTVDGDLSQILVDDTVIAKF